MRDGRIETCPPLDEVMSRSPGLPESMRRVWIAQWWDALRQDAWFTWRSWRRHPAFAVSAILVLALGIGINDIGHGLTLDQFEENYERILSTLKEKTQAQIVVTNIPNISSAPPAQLPAGPMASGYYRTDALICR